MVIGQASFNSNTSNAGGVSEKTISLLTTVLSRSALTFDKDGNLWFSDTLNNRVLRYPVGALNAGANGPAADVVLGQLSFQRTCYVLLQYFNPVDHLCLLYLHLLNALL